MISPAFAAAPAGCVPSTPSPTILAAATPDCAAPNATSSDALPAPSPNAPTPSPVPSRASMTPRHPSPAILRRIALRFGHTPRIQPPLGRKSRDPNVPPVLPQQVKQGQLMRRLSVIDQLNPRRYGPIPVADQMRQSLRPLLPGPVNHLSPGTKSPQHRPRSIADYLQFGTPATGLRPQAIQFQRPVRRQLRRGQRRPTQPRQTVLLTQCLPSYRRGRSSIPAWPS